MHTQTPIRRLWEVFNHAVITVRKSLPCELKCPPLVLAGYIFREPTELKQCGVNETN